MVLAIALPIGGVGGLWRWRCEGLLPIGDLWRWWWWREGLTRRLHLAVLVIRKVVLGSRVCLTRRGGSLLLYPGPRAKPTEADTATNPTYGTEDDAKGAASTAIIVGGSIVQVGRHCSRSALVAVPVVPIACARRRTAHMTAS